MPIVAIQKFDTSTEAKPQEDDQFTLDEYDSENEEQRASGKGPDNFDGLSSSTMALLERFKGRLSTQNKNDQDDGDDDDEDEDEDSEEDEDDEEPRLKYAYLTKHLGSVYRNGDATSSFLTAGDKMV